MKTIFYTFILLLISTFTFAEGTFISGKITNEDSKQPIAGAVIKINFFYGIYYTAISDSTGSYQIKTKDELVKDYYTLEISANNYYTLNGIILVSNNAQYNFSLKHKPITKKTVDTIISIKDTTSLVQTTSPKKNNLEGYATNNLVFLIDVSSSMNKPIRLPLLKESLKYLVDELRPTDKITLMAFSKTVEEVLPATFANQKELIKNAIDSLKYGSTTQGGLAVEKAYQATLQTFVENGNNRIVLASDGLFTSGKKDYKRIENSIKDGLKKQISISIFCFGKPTTETSSQLNKLANSGKGNFAVISNIDEAKADMLEEAKAIKQ